MITAPLAHLHSTRNHMTPRYQSRQLMRPWTIVELAPPVRTMAASWLSSCRFCSHRRSAGFRNRALAGVGARNIWRRAQQVHA